MVLNVRCYLTYKLSYRDLVAKDRPIDFPIPPVTTSREINTALGKVAEAVGAGTLTPGEGNSLAALLEVHRRGIESADLEERVERLEKESNERSRR